MLLQTLLPFSDVFEESLGHINVIQHKIDTGAALPIRQYPRCLPNAYRQETKNPVADMLRQGVTKPSSGPWASPIILVKKKRMDNSGSVSTTENRMLSLRKIPFQGPMIFRMH